MTAPIAESRRRGHHEPARDRLRIAIVRASALGQGGMRRVVESWNRSLTRLGHETIVVTQASSSRAPLPTLHGSEERPFAGPRWDLAGWRLLAAKRQLSDALTDLHEERPLDMLICHDALSVPTLRRRFPDVPLLATFHSPLVEENELNNWRYATSPVRLAGYPLTRWLAARIDRAALGSCTHIHTLSDHTWSLLAARYPDEAKSYKWTKIPGAYDPRRFHTSNRQQARAKLGLDPDAQILLSVRQLSPRYGIPRLFIAAKTAKAQGLRVQWLVGGNGPLLEDLRQQCHALGLGDALRLLDFIPEQDLPTFYQAANAFVLPTERLECFGLPVVEAMACGCVPLVTPSGGPEEICRDMPQLVAKANTDEAFCELALGFLKGHVQCGSRDLELTARRYSEDTLTPAIEQLVRRLAARGPSS